jgi:hypothetical protein
VIQVFQFGLDVASVERRAVAKTTSYWKITILLPQPQESRRNGLTRHFFKPCYEMGADLEEEFS